VRHCQFITPGADGPGRELVTDLYGCSLSVRVGPNQPLIVSE